MDNLTNRFIKYVKVKTTSDPESMSVPSTKDQLDLAKILKDELIELGLTNVVLDDKGYVYGLLKSNSDKKNKIGFISHMDTAPDFFCLNVNPKFINNYDGSDITLNERENIVLSTIAFPEILDFKGHDLIVTDGTTLLGADDKAGIAEIMTALEIIIKENIPHPDIYVGFTPDEEIGRGADHFDLDIFKADFAYTIDGGYEGEFEFENFNAASADICISGNNIHPGSAKGKMLNSILIAMELQSMLPTFDRPEFTENYEGFYLLSDITGSVEKTKMSYIIRDHDRKKFEAKKVFIKDIVDFLNKKYGDVIKLSIEDSYYNMREKIEDRKDIIDLALSAMKEAGIDPKVQAIRGGTDGARLSFMGLPTPNIFTGGMNYHGKYEYLSINSMKKAVETIVNIAKLSK